ncbi:WXG100 family type VII secretion target [Streptomyces sp. enrichment culture]|uniref:WXG100 family type VII secretion target n=1 Tax=Streptomyces sp. enrichment culture TaxID=1795815 RepID=UPI003F54C7AA
MGLPNTPAGAGLKPDLRVSDHDLTKLADDLDDMQDHLDKQVKRMDGVVDRIEAGWRGPAGSAYRRLHRAAAEDAVRIREVIRHLEQAVRLSKDGFTEIELEVLAQLQRIQVDVDSEVDRLSTPHGEPVRTIAPASPPRSSLDSF